MEDEQFVSVTFIGKKNLHLHVSTGIGTAFTTVKLQRSGASNTKSEREIDYLSKYYFIVHYKCVLCTETEHFADCLHKAVFRGHKTLLSEETNRLTLTHTYQHMQSTQKPHINYTQQFVMYVRWYYVWWRK